METAERQGAVTRLGSYEIVRRLARGGMADLFLARTVTDTFERLVVVKKILAQYADSSRFVQLFTDEARLAASLKHKNIVEVFDIGGVGGESFFAMEYLHGQDVRSILHRAWKRDEKMPIERAIQIGTQIASALHYAHDKRRADGTLLDIVHRDVSPSNVIVSYDGAVKLLDFGVAKAATSTVKTRTGTLKGKIAYMSPEQAKGGSVDRRSDVFSLGIVLWEMLTTSRLFRGENDLATLQLIINETPRRPSEANPDCPKELDRILHKALALDPKQRFQTALELQQELEEFVRTQQLVQSSNALGLYMNVLFQPEIESWREAKAAGTALSEHLTQIGINELTTPVSESEFIEPLHDDDEEYEDDLELAAMSGTIETSEAWPRKSQPTPAAAIAQAVPMPMAKVSSAPIVRPPVIAPALPPRQDPSGRVRTLGTPRPELIASPADAGRAAPPEAVRRSIDHTPRPELINAGMPSPVPGTIQPHARASTPGLPPPPDARPSWPHGMHAVSMPNADAVAFSFEQAQRLRKQFLRVGSGLIALLFLIAIIKTCASGSDEAKRPPPATPTPAVEPPPVKPPEPTPPPAVEPATVATPPAMPDAGAETVAPPVPQVEPPPAQTGSGAGSAKENVRRPPRKKPPKGPGNPFQPPVR